MAQTRASTYSLAAVAACRENARTIARNISHINWQAGRDSDGDSQYLGEPAGNVLDRKFRQNLMSNAASPQNIHRTVSHGPVAVIADLAGLSHQFTVLSISKHHTLHRVEHCHGFTIQS